MFGGIFMKTPKYLYSVNTFLAYKINEQYYKGTHYVWCAPRFDCNENPPSSNPKEIVKSLKRDIELRDGHSAKIEQNRLGLLQGVKVKYQQGIIDDCQQDALNYIISKAEISYFKPLIYIISYEKVKDKLIYVNPHDKASLFSEEYKIENLLSEEFDVIDINEC